MSKISDNHLDSIRRIILDWLARRDYSQQEIIQKLKKKGYFTEEINTVVAHLAQTGIINEPRFIENYIYWRREKGYGPLRVSMELRIRGITSEMIAEHMQITDNAWLIAAHSAWQKHFGSKLPNRFKLRNMTPSDLKLKAKQIRFLQYRGFTQEQIEIVMTHHENKILEQQ
ncbi:MAG: regulatory protein RecX [Gammaproteobacteria bacterium]|nr:regulatory protein RecX [Gammaproteobacteria bacterium]MCW5582672.1 regulatory protein RecX [Gammaproteobacteria bacterium]